jgi:hypothetical protein
MTDIRMQSASKSDSRHPLVEQQRRIAEIGRIVNSTLELNEVFSAFAGQARELLPFHRLVISLVDDEHTT